VTKNEVGVIRIFDRETTFEIAEAHAPRFMSSVRRSTNDEDIRIEPFEGPKAPPKKAHKPFARKRPEGEPRHADTPPPRRDGPPKDRPPHKKAKAKDR
jgi:ATP-dependent RNA helicase DeaD